MKNRKNKPNEHSHRESSPEPEEIARRAYQLYLERGGDPGRDFDDWLQAERELKERVQVGMSY